MIELVTGGGLGDAAMSFAKAHARYSDNIDDIKLDSEYVNESDPLDDPSKNMKDDSEEK